MFPSFIHICAEAVNRIVYETASYVSIVSGLFALLTCCHIFSQTDCIQSSERPCNAKREGEIEKIEQTEGHLCVGTERREQQRGMSQEDEREAGAPSRILAYIYIYYGIFVYVYVCVRTYGTAPRCVIECFIHKRRTKPVYPEDISGLVALCTQCYTVLPRERACTLKTKRECIAVDTATLAARACTYHRFPSRGFLHFYSRNTRSERRSRRKLGLISRVIVVISRFFFNE